MEVTLTRTKQILRTASIDRLIPLLIAAIAVLTFSPALHSFFVDDDFYRQSRKICLPRAFYRGSGSGPLNLIAKTYASVVPAPMSHSPIVMHNWGMYQ
jgi:hypothetical protein